MNAEKILGLIEGKGQIEIEQDIIFNILEFHTSREEYSLMNLALTLNHHEQIKKYSFDILKLEKWCEENNLRYYMDEVNRSIHIVQKVFKKNFKKVLNN
tara:strand:+ start:3661 stop:3957 length:297 start_codon:yes stop_codon:yes gene_type:complete